MTKMQDRILDFLNRFPGRDDDELARVLKISPRQSVNMACRKLQKKGAIRRVKGP
jgi:DNA-binding MarR family transcriptional regulator